MTPPYASPRPLMQEVKALIDRDYAMPLTMSRLARHVRMSAMRMQREFAAVFGESPRSYLIRKRMEKARRQLREGEDEQVVAEAVGYYSVDSFRSDFRSWFGHVPERKLAEA